MLLRNTRLDVVLWKVLAAVWLLPTYGKEMTQLMGMEGFFQLANSSGVPKEKLMLSGE